jgi:indole-3-glycerol phosphate synthase
LALGAQFIGINNRNLRTFETRLDTSINLAIGVPQGRLLVSESGIVNHDHIRRLHQQAGIGTFLVGESLMRQEDVVAATRTLLMGAPEVAR